MAEERIVSQLRTGYVGLSTCINATLKTVIYAIVVQRNLCHLHLHCPEYETEREIMRKQLFETCGISHLDLNLLLDAKQDDKFKDWKSSILTELENFVVGTGWFTTLILIVFMRTT